MCRNFKWFLATIAVSYLTFGSMASADPRGEAEPKAFPEQAPLPIAKVPGYDLELPYTTVEGEPVFVMGDMLLDEATLEVFFADLREPGHVAPRHTTTGSTWPDGIVPYVISTPALADAVHQAIDYIEANSNVRFVPRSNEKGYMDFIDRGNKRCQAWAGYAASRRIVDLDKSEGCAQQYVVRHEIMHSLSFYHTHQRPDRDMYVNYFSSCVRSGGSEDFRKSGSTIPGIPYDLRSIMHYDSEDSCKRVCTNTGNVCYSNNDCPSGGTCECLCCPLEVDGAGCPSPGMGGTESFRSSDRAALAALYPDVPLWGACTDSGTKTCVHVQEQNCSGANTKWFAGQECGEVGACCWSNFGCECDILDEDACRGRPYCHGGLCRPGGKFWPGEWCGAPPCESASCYSQWDLLGTRED
ncbi:MAG: hypothetical protein GY719_28190 [bacterium]|nr:hypothetical protein [bacterium]